LGEEILEFYQPDEDLKLEDIFPDVDISTPERMAAAKEELLRCVNAALARMPRAWRRALRLRHGEGLTGEELAEALEKAEPEIERILEYARQHLRQSLLEAGCTLSSREVRIDRSRRAPPMPKSGEQKGLLKADVSPTFILPCPRSVHLPARREESMP